MWIGQLATFTRTYVVSDSVMGTTGWVKIAGINPGAAAELWCNPDHTGGAVTISITHGNATGQFRTIAMEWPFGGAITVDATSSLNEGANGTSHASSSAGVTSTHNVVAFCAGALDSTGATDCTPGTGYTEVLAWVSGVVCFQYKAFPTGCTNETGPWTSTGTAKKGTSVIALIRSTPVTTTLTPAKGTLTITGLAPTLKRTIKPPAGSIAISGFSPNPIGAESGWEAVGSSATNESSAGLTVTRTITGVQTGDFVLAYADHQGGPGTMSVSDGTSTFTQDPNGIQHNPDGDPHSCFFYLLSSVATGSVTYTLTFDAPRPYSNFQVWVERPSSACSYEDSNSASSASGSTADSGNITTTGADGVAFGAYAEYGKDLGNPKINGLVRDSNLVSLRSMTWLKAYFAGFTGAAVGTVNDGPARWNCHAIAFKIGGGPTTTTLTPDAGTLTLTGRTPVVVLRLTVPVPKGTLTLTDLAPALNLSIAIPKAAITLTGLAPASLTGTRLAPAKGTLTLTGLAPTIAASDQIRLEPSPAALTLTGYAPVSTTTAHVRLEPGAGVITLTGLPPIALVYAPGGESIHRVFRGVSSAAGSDLLRDADQSANGSKLLRSSAGGPSSLYRR